MRKGQTPDVETIDDSNPNAGREPVTRVTRVSRPGRIGGPEMLGTRGSREFVPKNNPAQRIPRRGK